MLVVDAHEDLAWNSLTFGRDYLRPVAETRAREVGGAAPPLIGDSLIGWPEWVAGRVALVVATLYASPASARLGGANEAGYVDAAAAHRLYRAQLEWYHRWVAAHPDKLALIRTPQALEALLAEWADGASGRVGLLLLMEGAEGIQEPEEVGWWAEQGVRLIGPAWTRTRYVGGTGDPGPFTPAGRALLRAMARHELLLDLSHLSDEGAAEALAEYEGALLATHCVPRALLPSSKSPERHLSDESIRGIAARDGVIGVVLANSFLADEWRKGDPREAVTLAAVVRAIDYMVQLIGDADHVALGSDFDGGFGLQHVPVGLDSVADLPRIGEALQARGYPAAAVEGILGGNMLRLLHRAL